MSIQAPLWSSVGCGNRKKAEFRPTLGRWPSASVLFRSFFPPIFTFRNPQNDASSRTTNGNKDADLRAVDRPITADLAVESKSKSKAAGRWFCRQVRCCTTEETGSKRGSGMADARKEGFRVGFA